MAYFTPIHQATSVRMAVRLNLFGPDKESLVIAKANVLEIWDVGRESMTLRETKVVYGTISMLQRLRPQDSRTDAIFFGTERFQYFTIVWDGQLKVTNAVDDDTEPFMRASQSQNRCVVDPDARIMVMHQWEGVISMFRIGRARQQGVLVHMCQMRISELWVLASEFIPAETGHPTLAFLYRDRPDAEEVRLVLYRVTADDKHTQPARFDPSRDRLLNMSLPDPTARLLIQVPIVEKVKRHFVRNKTDAKLQVGGLLVIGTAMLVYMDGRIYSSIVETFPEPRLYCAWARYDATTYLLGDELGALHLLRIVHENAVVGRVTVEPLQVLNGISVNYNCASNRDGCGRTSRASALVYMGDDMLFVASHHGDPQLIRLDLASLECTVVQMVRNTAPVLDFFLLDLAARDRGASHRGSTFASGRSQVVAACGAWEDGTVRTIRTAVAVEDLAILDADLGHVRDVFALRTCGGDEESGGTGSALLLLAARPTDTRIFRVLPGGDGVEEIASYAGLRAEHQTILAGNAANGNHFYVGPREVRIIGPRGVRMPWPIPDNRTITQASANGTWLLLSLDGTTLVSLNLLDGTVHHRGVDIDRNPDYNTLAIPMEAEVAAEAERAQIACVHASQASAEVGVIAFWAASSVTVISLRGLEDIRRVDLGWAGIKGAIVREVALVRLRQQRPDDSDESAAATLLVALDDGSIVSFSASAACDDFTRGEAVSLGTQVARLHVLPHRADSDTCDVLATADRCTLISSIDGSVIFSAVDAEDAVRVAPLPRYHDGGMLPLPPPFAAACAGSDTVVVIAAEDPAADGARDHIRISRIIAPSAAAPTRRTTHMTVSRFGCTVRRLAHCPGYSAVALGCIGRRIEDGQEVVESSVRLLDETTQHETGDRFLLNESAVCEIVEAVSVAVLPDSYGEAQERIIVGTRFAVELGVLEESGGRMVGGRILVLGVQEDQDRRSPYQLANHRTKFPCTCLGTVGDRYLVAGLGVRVVVYEYKEQSSVHARLIKLADFTPSSYLVDIQVCGTTIGVLDLLHSLVVLEFTPPSQGGRQAVLTERARHVGRASATALCGLDEEGEHWLLGDVYGNIVLLKIEEEGEGAGGEGEEEEEDGNDVIADLDVRGRGAEGEGRRRKKEQEEKKKRRRKSRLIELGDASLGEQINRIERFHLSPSADVVVNPMACIGTVEGSFYMIGLIVPRYWDLLSDLQTRVADHLQKSMAEGEPGFSAWRAYRDETRTAPEPNRFVDGGMVEQFLDLDGAAQAQVCYGLADCDGVEETRGVVEKLRRMH